MVRTEWLKTKVTVAEAEAAEQVYTDAWMAALNPPLEVSPGPFGPIQNQWDLLRGRMQEGDELWSFRAPDEEWDKNNGWEGYAVLRGGLICDELSTRWKT